MELRFFHARRVSIAVNMPVKHSATAVTNVATANIARYTFFHVDISAREKARAVDQIAWRSVKQSGFFP
jgi:hypothetical protein